MLFYKVKDALLQRKRASFDVLACKIILKIQLVENKEVTLLVELNW